MTELELKSQISSEARKELGDLEMAKILVSISHKDRKKCLGKPKWSI